MNEDENLRRKSLRQTRVDGDSTLTEIRPTLVWFRHDLRLGDNPALWAAVNRGSPVVCLYLLDDETPGDWAHGRASRWWLHHGLRALADDLDRCHALPLILRRGRGEQVIAELAEEIDAGAVFWNRSYAPFDREPDSRLKTRLREQGRDARSFNGNLLSEPAHLRNKSGGEFKVFTPYYRTLSAQDVAEPLPAPSTGDLLAPPASLSAHLNSLSLNQLGLLPTAPDWSAGLQAHWTPGEAGAVARFTAFAETAMADYEEGRNRPDRDACSRLSPFLKFGHISPRQVWHWTLARLGDDIALREPGWAFLREIGWREFSYYLLYQFPTLLNRNWRPSFDGFPWRDDPAGYLAWSQGQTGYPMVDAGMRELWQTGWMHNRLRMITGSFLVKHLLISWQQGERWFWDTLVDADIASNAASWQWVSGCGADAAPYFRIFNPISQGSKFDPEGSYTRRYVPEIAALDTRQLFSPWEAEPLTQKAAGIVPGETYPRPIVDHAQARARALAAFASIKSSPEKSNSTTDQKAQAA